MKETKELLKFAIELGEAIDKALADGKLDVNDLPLLIAPLMHVGPAFEGVEKVKEELKAMDAVKMAELVKFAKDELQLESKRTEEVIKEALELAVRVYAFVQLFKK